MPDGWVSVRLATGETLVPRARWCASFSARLRGMTFRRHLPANGGLILVERQDSRLATAIHMLFVFFDLAVVWANAQGVVVDRRLARPFRLFYAPRAPARYVLEAHPDLLIKVTVGDCLVFSTLP